MADHTLAPCPFCGGEAKLTASDVVGYIIICDNHDCISATDWFGSSEQAAAAWNRRASPPAAVPDGWVMVPKEPTPEMLDAATPPASEWIGHPEARPESIERWRRSHREAAGDRYRVMISAAPAAPTEARDE